MHLPDSAVAWAECLRRGRDRSLKTRPLVVEGHLTLEVVGCQLPIGTRCDVISRWGVQVEAEVVGFAGEHTYLMPTGHVDGLTPNTRVEPSAHTSEAPVGEAMLGRPINPLFSVGRGQRMGLFAGSGVGKSVLIGMMTRYTEADVVVPGTELANVGCINASMTMPVRAAAMISESRVA